MDPPATRDVPAAQVFETLLDHCRRREWAGHDPYDALNSAWLPGLALLDSRIPRLVLTQFLKRSPIDTRELLRVPRKRNPKALALFLSAFLTMDRIGALRDPALIGEMTGLLAETRSPGDRPEGQACWGYSFPWQTRTRLVPRGAPNLVCTAFVGDALVEAHERDADPALLDLAGGAARYIAHELYAEDGAGHAFLRYPTPESCEPVHNANLLGAALLARVHAHTGESLLRERALAVARYSASRQRADGSWFYGEGTRQQWIDGFHTGFNLCALRSLGTSLRSDEFEPALKAGLVFYRDHFFLADGTPRYFHDHTYPIDIHSATQAIITFARLCDADPDGLALAERVFAWTLEHMRDARGHFHYRKYPLLTNRIDYMRWSQAWMLLATACLMEARATPAGGSPTRGLGPAT